MPLPNYNPSSPCFCFSKCTPNPTCKTCKTGDCFELGTIVVSPNDSVGPCNEMGIVPFDCFCYPCEDPIFTITNLESIKGLTVTKIDKDGLEFTTDGTLEANNKVEICFKAGCMDDGEYKSDYGSVIIYMKDLCEGVNCPNGVCDDCAGDCVNTDPEIQVVDKFYVKPEIKIL